MPKSAYSFGPLDLQAVTQIAMEKAGLKTLDALAERVGVAASTVYQWRARKRLPSDDTMLVLGAMAGLLPLEALLLLNMWRNDGHAHGVYIRALKEHGYHYINPVSLEVEYFGKPKRPEEELDDGMPIWIKSKREQIPAE